jgi:carbonic anhydrase
VGLVDNWLSHVRDVRDRHHLPVQLPDGTQVEALCELNVLEQVRHVCDTTFVQDAWTRGQKVVIHGWVYGLHNGIINDLRITVTGPPT